MPSLKLRTEEGTVAVPILEVSFLFLRIGCNGEISGFSAVTKVLLSVLETLGKY